MSGGRTHPHEGAVFQQRADKAFVCPAPSGQPKLSSSHLLHYQTSLRFPKHIQAVPVVPVVRLHLAVAPLQNTINTKINI